MQRKPLRKGISCCSRCLAENSGSDLQKSLGPGTSLHAGRHQWRRPHGVPAGSGRSLIHAHLADWPSWVTELAQRRIRDRRDLLWRLPALSPGRDPGAEAAGHQGPCPRRRISPPQLGDLRAGWRERLFGSDLGRSRSGATAADCGEPEQKLHASNLRYCLAGFSYYFWTFMLTPVFPRYETHRELDIVGEADAVAAAPADLAVPAQPHGARAEGHRAPGQAGPSRAAPAQWRFADQGHIRVSARRGISSSIALPSSRRAARRIRFWCSRTIRSTAASST